MSGLAVLSFAMAFCSQAKAKADEPAPLQATIEMPMPKPGMGWSSYNFFLAGHNEELLHRMAGAFEASGLHAAGYDILRIDGGWWGDDSNRRWYYWTQDGQYEGGAPYHAGDPHVDARNYPGGIKRLADYLHARGFKLSFYLSPEISTGQSANYPDNKDTVLQPATTGLSLVEQHARWAADNGLDHLFYDGYTWNENQGYEPYKRMFMALRDEAKRANRPIAFSINTGQKVRPPAWADEWRTATDINSQWPTIMDSLSSVADPGVAGKGHWNEAGYLMVGFLGDEEARSQMSLWCVAGAPLYLSHDFRVLNDWDAYVLLNTEAIAVDQDARAAPGRRLRSDGNAQVWARTLSDGSRAVALFNAGEVPLEVGVRWTELGLPDEAAWVRDLWAHHNLGAIQTGTSVRLAPHSCALLKIQSGATPLSQPKATWAPEPAPKPNFKPLSSQGWTVQSDLSRRDDAFSNLFDGDSKTAFWSWASAGNSLTISFPRALTFDRMVIDHSGVGPNPWPYKVFAPRSTFALEASQNGTNFQQIAEGSFGPTSTIATFKPVQARALRLVLTNVEKTSAYTSTSWSAKDIYLFDTRSRARP